MMTVSTAVTGVSSDILSVFPCLGANGSRIVATRFDPKGTHVLEWLPVEGRLTYDPMYMFCIAECTSETLGSCMRPLRARKPRSEERRVGKECRSRWST